MLAVLNVLYMSGQDITGQWSGILNIQSRQLTIVFNVTQTADGYISIMDIPDQGARGIPVTSTNYTDSKLALEIENLKIQYSGELTGDSIVGIFTQSELNIPLVLTREMPDDQTIKRPQEPVQPYPYYFEDVTFQNKQAGITLAGTLTLPGKEGSFPAVVLISGSGQQNRNEEVAGHRPFLVISDYLTRNGIAVLRYDDRGVGQSTGDFATATSVDFAKDAESAVEYLKTRNEINNQKIGLIGHSEGGMIAPMVASTSDDVSFIVLLAGTGIRGDSLIMLQSELILRANGVPESAIQKADEINAHLFDMVQKETDIEKLRAGITGYLYRLSAGDPDAEIPEDMNFNDNIKRQVDEITSPWMLFFLRYNPATALEHVKCPVLAINGEKDLQVPPKENLSAISAALKKNDNTNVTIEELPGLNHLFQECNTGSPMEYESINQTISPVALEIITKWIINQL